MSARRIAILGGCGGIGRSLVAALPRAGGRGGRARSRRRHSPDIRRRRACVALAVDASDEAFAARGVPGARCAMGRARRLRQPRRVHDRHAPACRDDRRHLRHDGAGQFAHGVPGRQCRDAAAGEGQRAEPREHRLGAGALHPAALRALCRVQGRHDRADEDAGAGARAACARQCRRAGRGRYGVPARRHGPLRTRTPPARSTSRPMARWCR